MFLIMGFAHLLAAWVLLFTGYNESNDMIVHLIGGLVEFAIGLVIFFNNDCKFEI